MRASKRFVSNQTYLVYPKPAGNSRLPGELLTIRRQFGSARHRSWRRFCGGPRLRARRIPTSHRLESCGARATADDKTVCRRYKRRSVSAIFFELRFADVEEKLSQLTLWVIEAERARQPYGLRLPGVEISPAVGQMHFHYCLRALSLFRTGMSTSNSSSPIKRDTSIPRRPLLWMAAALLFTLPPFFDSLAIWVPWLFLVSLALKFWMEPRGYRLRSVVLKLMLVATALTAAFVSYGSVRAAEAGISLLVVLMSLKILEAHTAREFRVMVLIGWMLCLCGFFLSQDLTTALCLLIAFALLAVALIQFHRGAHRARCGLRSLRLANSSFKPRRLSVLFFPPVSRINAGLRV